MNFFDQFKKDFSTKKILIMGLGLQGRGIGDARFFAEIGAGVVVTDLKTEPALKPALAKLRGLPIKFVLGRHRKKDFEDCDVVIRNAAVPENSSYLKTAQKAGAKIFMDESLFVQYAPVNIIGVTGTRGKTTTATLIYQILKKAGEKVYLGGNVLGMATLPLLRKIKEGDWVVLELSSWQLQGLGKVQFSPYIAVVTNFYPDHLNRYSAVTDYLNDKKNIFRFQKKGDFLILNEDQKILRSLTKEASCSKILWFGKKDLPVDWELNIRGEHNRANAAAARKVAQILGVSENIIRSVIETFKGVKYRLETIARIKGVNFVNDTTSTMPQALAAGLEAITNPIVLIAGGASKNLSLEEIALKITQKTKKIVLLKGSGTRRLHRFIVKCGGGGKILGTCGTLKLAVEKAFGVAETGDVILFSPGFASFGMFKNEYDRGEQFNKIVNELAYGWRKRKKKILT